MKSSKAVRSCAARKNARVVIRALLVGFFSLDRQAWAQSVLAPGPQAPDQTPVALQQVNEMDVFASPAPPTASQPFKWGAFVLRPHPFYQFQYADGLLANVNETENSTIQQISVGALLEMGRHWTLDYTPQWTIYSNNHFSDTFGQTLRLVGGATYDDWVLRLSQDYANVSSLSVETATQTRQETYTTAVNGLCTLNSKMSLDLALNQNIVSADQFSSYSEWSTLDWLNYQFAPRLNVALGAGGGYDDVSASPDMTFEQVQGRVGWRATDKVSFQLHGGVEFRQFVTGGASPLVNPVFDATIQYQPFEQTRISVTGSRVVSDFHHSKRTHRNHIGRHRSEPTAVREALPEPDRQLSDDKICLFREYFQLQPPGRSLLPERTVEPYLPQTRHDQRFLPDQPGRLLPAGLQLHQPSGRLPGRLRLLNSWRPDKGAGARFRTT